MTAADVVSALLRANLALSAAILLVMALRAPTRRLFGAEVAYALWLLPLLAAVASVLPARAVLFWPMLLSMQTLTDIDTALVDQPPPGEDHSALIAGLWAAGALLGVLALAVTQARFLGKARAGEIGPALVGVIHPQIVVPTDYYDRFSEDERDLIRMHERVHIARSDSRVNALLAAFRCLNWFNPLAHWAADKVRLDQELACDAAVLRKNPKARRRYAATLLKAQLAEQSPLACAWRADRQHPLELRLKLIAAGTPTGGRRIAGAGLAAGLACGVFYLAWPSLPTATVRHAAPPPGPVILLRAAARLVVIPEDRDSIAATITPGARGTQGLRLRRVGPILVVEDGSPHAGLPSALNAIRCERSPSGPAVRTGDRVTPAADLPVVTARVPLDARVSADGAVFGEVGPSRRLSLFTRGCGDWRLAKAAKSLAIYSDGDGMVDAAGVDWGSLMVHRVGQGRVLVRDGRAPQADIRNAGTGEVTYDGAANELDAAVSGPGMIRVRQVYGRVYGAVWGKGDIAFRRADGQQFCLSCETPPPPED
jgi:beta-lactamase regulating signal transducer with metallopeptidase domain